MSSGLALMPRLHWAHLTNLPLATLRRDSADATSGLWLDPMGSLVKQPPCFLLFLNFSCSTETTTVTIFVNNIKEQTLRQETLSPGRPSRTASCRSSWWKYPTWPGGTPELQAFHNCRISNERLSNRKEKFICLDLRDDLTFPFRTLAISYPKRWQSGP